MPLPLKVLLYNDTYQHLGGAETYCIELLQHLAQYGCEAYWMAHGEIPPSAPNHIVLPVSNQGKLNYFISKYFFNPTAYQHIKTALAALAPDVVHIHHDRYYTAALAKALAELKIPVVQHVHDYTMLCPSQYYPDLYYQQASGKSRKANCQLICSQGSCLPWYSRLGHPFAHDRKRKAVQNRIPTFIAPSTQLKSYLERAGFSNVHYLPFFIQPSQWSFNAHRTVRNKVLFVGRVETNKGIHILVDAVLKLREKLPDIQLTVVGTGSQLPLLQQRITQEKLTDCIQLEGYVPYTDISTYYEQANVLVVPSLDMEQFGLIGIEGLASGTAVVGSDTGGIPEWCIHEKTGLLFSPEHPQQLSAQLFRMLTEDGLAEKLTQNGMALIRDKFNPQKHFQTLVSLYENARPIGG